MGSIRREIVVRAAADWVWAALRDIGAVASLFPGVLIDSRADGDGRLVTFADGQRVRERIIDVDDATRRIVYSAQAEGFAHHNASMQIVPEPGGASRFVWISDFLPDDARGAIEPLIDAGTAAFGARWNG